MSANASDCEVVLRELRELCRECRTQQAAAKQLGIVKSTLTKWFRNRHLSTGALRLLARSEDCSKLAQAAQKALSSRGLAASRFDFARVGSILATCGESQSLLMVVLERDAPAEDLEFAAAHDLVATFADAQFYHALAELSREGFEHVPEHPLLWLENQTYEEVFHKVPDEEDIEVSGPQEINWKKIDWEEVNAPYARRSDASYALLDCARSEPKHKLFDRVVATLYSRAKKRDSELPRLSSEECLRYAALAAADCYKLESAAMEAADTIRRAVDGDRALENSPLYALAAKVYEICFLNRTFTVGRLSLLAEEVRDDKETCEAIEARCKLVHLALHSQQGIYLSHFSTASAHVNAHGSVIDYESGRVVRSVVGSKRKAPRRAIVRADREASAVKRRSRPRA